MFERGDAFLIRRARLSDLEEIAAIHADGETGGALYDRRLTLWSNVLGGGPRRAQVWVSLVSSGEILGFVSAGRCRVLKAEYDGEIIALYVARAARLRGIGRALMGEALVWLKGQGFRSTMAWVGENEPGARVFFRKNGAKEGPERRSTPAVEIAVGWTGGQ